MTTGLGLAEENLAAAFGWTGSNGRNIMTTPLELVVLDMAGTTVLDDGVVEQAFQRAAERTGVADRMPWAEALDYVRVTWASRRSTSSPTSPPVTGPRPSAPPPRSRGLTPRSSPSRGVSEIPGAAGRHPGAEGCRAEGRADDRVRPVTRDALIDGLGWQELIDLALSPVDAGRGRPAPDLVLTALLRTQTSSVRAVAVAGDTVSDVESGRRAGAASSPVCSPVLTIAPR